MLEQCFGITKVFTVNDGSVQGTAPSRASSGLGNEQSWKVRIVINFAFFLLKVQNVPPSCLSCTMELDMSGHWTAFQSKWGCWKCSFAWGTGESTTNLSAHVLWRVPGCPWPWDYCSWYEIFVNENPWRFAEFHHFPFEHEISLQFSTGAFWHFYFNDVRAACYCQAHN